MAIPFLAVWNLATCSKHEALYIHYASKAKLGFVQAASFQRNSSARGCLCHPSCLLWLHGFWQTFEAAGCVQSVMSQPQKQDCHTLQRVDLARPFLVSPAIKIEIENSLEMALSKAKSGSAWQSRFWQCGTLRPARNTKLFTYITQVKQSWVLFKQQAFNATGEGHFLESKKPMCLRPRK